MKIKLTNKYAVEYQNGYYVVWLHGVRGVESKDAGEDFYHSSKTFAFVTGAYRELNENYGEGDEGELGLSLEEVKEVYKISYDACQVLENRAYLIKKETDKASALKRKETKLAKL